MELKELIDKTLDIFCVGSVDDLGDALMESCWDPEHRTMLDFAKMVGDLSVDWLQMIFQYYLADRKEKMQDYTPRSLAEFVGKLVGDADEVIDMCAGSGALAIQRWNSFPDTRFKLFELDENVIPYLLFNMAVRNIDCTVYRADVLRQETYQKYRIRKGERFG